MLNTLEANDDRRCEHGRRQREQKGGENELMTLSSTLDRISVGEQSTPCRQDPELWFAQSPANVELAKQLCRNCPVQTQCLAGAMDRAEPWGVWGGELFISGVVVACKRPRGRPRKSDTALTDG